MQATQEQLGAYLLWLKDRGLRHPVPVKTTPKKRIQVAFVGDAGFKPEERDLLMKMIAAMQLSGEHAIIERLDDYAAFQTTHAAELVIPLGAATAAAFFEAGFAGETMPTLHPRDLLARPDDKRVAWNDLKRAMARLKA